MNEFFRGARIKPAQKRPLADDINYPQFMLAMAQCVVSEYGIRDKERFLKHCELAFEFAMASVQQGNSSETTT